MCISYSVAVDKGHQTAVNDGQLRRNGQHGVASTVASNTERFIGDEPFYDTEVTHYLATFCAFFRTVYL